LDANGESILSGLDSLIESLREQERSAGELRLILSEKEALAERLRLSLADYSNRLEQSLETRKQLETDLSRTRRTSRFLSACIPAALAAGLLAGLIIPD
jgi:flagellar biosynthesis chaperone FliJ